MTDLTQHTPSNQLHRFLHALHGTSTKLFLSCMAIFSGAWAIRTSPTRMSHGSRGSTEQFTATLFHVSTQGHGPDSSSLRLTTSPKVPEQNADFGGTPQNTVMRCYTQHSRSVTRYLYAFLKMLYTCCRDYKARNFEVSCGPRDATTGLRVTVTCTCNPYPHLIHLSYMVVPRQPNPDLATQIWSNSYTGCISFGCVEQGWP